MRALHCLAFASLLAATAAVHAAPATYTLDPDHTQVRLTWNHFGYSNPSANIGVASGTLVFDPAHPERASVQVSMHISSLDTHVAALDSHLQQADFFDAAKYPQATFKSTRVQALGAGKFKVSGELAVHGVVRPIVLDATLNRVGVHPMTKVQSIGFDATTQLKRADFGVGAYVPDVSDEIRVHITSEGSVAGAPKP